MAAWKTRVDRIGQRYGRLLITGSAGSKLDGGGNTRSMWNCRCDCGGSVTVKSSALVTGNTKSCGCLQREKIKNLKLRHRHSHSPTWKVWMGMKQRCQNPRSTAFRYYGGRGIRLCERWQLFDHFLADMGVKPNDLTIERIDVNGHYEPGNCRWASFWEQSLNKTTTHRITLNGKTQSLMEWCRELGLRYGTIKCRIRRYGWDTATALTMPTRPRTGTRVGWKK